MNVPKIGLWLRQLPLTLYRRWGYRIMIPFAAATVVSVLSVMTLSLSATRIHIVPEDDEYVRRVRSVEEQFGSTELIVMIVDVEGRLTAEDLHRIDRVASRARSLDPDVTVVSLTTLEDLVTDGDAILTVRLYDPAARDQSRILERLDGTELFQKLFLSASGDAAFVFIIPPADAEPVSFAGWVMDELSDSSVRVYGDPVIIHHTTTTTGREFVFLTLVGLLIVLIVEAAITRSVTGGLLLSTVSILPALWTLALFPVFGHRLDISNLPVPVIIMVLATSYGIHVYRHARHWEFDLDAAVREISNVVLVAGLTTIAGFLSLVLSRSVYLRQLGLLIVIGTAFALVCALVLLPQLLRLWSAHRRPTVRPTDGQRARIGGEPRSPRSVVAAMSVAFITLLFGIPLIQSRATFRDAFDSSHPVSTAVAHYRALTGADHEVALIMDTRQEYGLVDLETFDTVRRLQRTLEDELVATRSVSYVDFVEWILGRMAGSVGPIRPSTDNEIGEALELLSGRGVGQGIESLVDRSWRYGRVALSVDLSAGGGPTGLRWFSTARGQGSIEDITRIGSSVLPGIGVSLVGEPMTQLRNVSYLVRSQVVSLALFACFLVVLVLVLFRSARYAVYAVLPTVVGAVTYFGLMGWTGIRHDVTHVLLVCMLLGVSNDDVLYYLLVYRKARESIGRNGAARVAHSITGVPIIQTTLVIVSGVSVFYASAVTYLGMAAFLVTAGLVAATATTLRVVPVLIAIGERADARSKSR